MNEANDATLTLLVEFRKASRTAFSSIGLTTREALILIYLNRGHGQPRELSKLLGIVLSAVSAIAAKFAKAGWLCKEEHNNDSRRVRYILTPSGVELCRRVEAAWEEERPPLTHFDKNYYNVNEQ